MAVVADTAPAASRALSPAESGHASSGGVRIGYEVFGEGGQTLLLLPPWAIIHSRFWKLQVPYLARYFRVVTFDARGNGRSDRPETADDYGPRRTAADALSVLAAVGADDCVFVAHCGTAAAALLLAAENPDRVRGAVFMSPALPITPPRPERTGFPFNEVLDTDEGWAKANRHYWARDYDGYLEFFFDRCFSEPHSTKQREDAIDWAHETTPETIALTLDAKDLDEPTMYELLGRLRCPLLVTQGDEDLLVPADRGAKFAELTGAERLDLDAVGHCPQGRHPVSFNLVVRDFAERAYGRPPGPPPWRRAIRRPKRALYVSSPIGLGHAWRDVAIARELRALEPGLQIDWLAQEPVTSVLEACGERVHPASELLANESRHIAAESREHELDVFQAWRRMDEILLANFMLFHDVAGAENYDLWIGDEAWELDYYLHENPELKTAAYCFLTDFVGWLPMPEGGEREARLTADYNAEMIEQIARFPRVRDRAIFVGSPEDVVPHGFGEGLPEIRPWVEEHFDFSGYVLAPDAGPPVDREALRAELGYRPDERVCVVTVGGSGVGTNLLTRVIEALPEARRRVPELRMLVVCGPRIDPASLPAVDGAEVVGYVHGLSRHLAACDVAVVQGGLTTCMELTAAKRPFIYFPLRRHFEQNLHVRHRLERYGGGRSMDFDTATPESIGDAIAASLGEAPAPADVERDGAARAARMIASLL
ncbi:MAG TPA: alpha/beta fold hydrolase [Thermoleophilaceae bacterium]|jgi:pimeloyl-ACP methyl ester carboxylesterase/predicted glycosyltransferase